MAGNLGFDTILISDATATFDRVGVNGQRFDSETIHQTTLANLNEEFSRVINSKTLLEIAISDRPFMIFLNNVFMPS